ncbi:MAG: hypothetical protein ACX94C_07810 [Phycisphaerales bacterium]
MKATAIKPREKPSTWDITHYERGMTDGSRDGLAGRPNSPTVRESAYLRGYERGYKQGEHTRKERVQRRSMT